eukprot:5933725-Prorocentrum_lima.AAC.1
MCTWGSFPSACARVHWPRAARPQRGRHGRKPVDNATRESSISRPQQVIEETSNFTSGQRV